MTTTSKLAPSRKLQAVPALPVDPEFNAAKQQYAEQFGDALVTAMYLKVVILILAVVCVGLLVLNFRTFRVVQDFKPLVIRVDQVGHAEAVRYDNFKYTPQEAEIKYFLSQFCHLYYGRNRYTVKDNFSKAVLFLDQSLGNSVVQAWNANHTIDNYMQGVDQYDQEVQINRVSIEDLRSAPYKASVEYQVIYISPIDRKEIKRAGYTAQFVFAFRDSVPNDLIQVNPLGLAITYFREDEAFISR